LASRVLAMDQRDELFTDEYMRYAAECRRLARLAKPLARKPSGIARWSAYLNFTSWIALLQPADATDRARRPQFATAARRR
jgi:hypothetical protein